VKILVDVNIFEDIYRQRAGWEASLAVVSQVRAGKTSGYVSALTPPILYFLRRRTQSEQLCRRTVRQLLASFKIIPIGEETLEAAYDSSLPDFEDAIQFRCAQAASVDRIVTRNKSDFKQDEIAVTTPEELLEEP
jgi:predicted nucleic acid-binding protein